MQPFAFNSYLMGHGEPFLILFLILLPIVIILKAFALWYSARGNQKWWFIAMLIINTIGILEVIYLIFFRPKEKKEAKNADNSNQQQQNKIQKQKEVDATKAEGEDKSREKSGNNDEDHKSNSEPTH